MKLDGKTILITALIALVIALILTRGCGQRPIQRDGVNVEYVYDSIEKVILSKVPEPETITIANTRTLMRWLPGAIVRDTIFMGEEPIYIYNDAPIDTDAVISHYLTQAVTYTDTIKDSSLQAVITDTIFRNRIVGREFRYKWLRPTEIVTIDNRDRFQLIVSAQFGAGATYANQPNGIYGGVDLGLKFKSGTYFSVGYMAGTSHFATLRAGQVIRLRKR